MELSNDNEIIVDAIISRAHSNCQPARLQCHHMWKQRKNIEKLSRRGNKQMLHTKIANAKERETTTMRLLCLANESTKALVSTPSRAACAFFSSLYTSVFFVCAQTPRNDIVLQSLSDVRNKQKIKRCFVHVTWARLLTNEKKNQQQKIIFPLARS